MSVLFDKFFDRLLKYGLEYFGLYYGEYDGTCTSNEDPEEQGRIQVRVPNVTGNTPIGAWAWPSMPAGGFDKGMFWVPDVNDPVVVTFRNGNPSYPKYRGGYWPNVKDGDKYAPEGAYTDGVPTKKILKTKAGHELTFDDNPDDLTIKLIWADKTDPAAPKFTFFAITKEGNVQMANHVGAFLELRAKEGDELNMLMDKYGNSFIQDKDGVKIVDASGNAFTLTEGVAQLIGTDQFIVNVPGINFKTGGLEIGDVATDKALKGTSFMAWWNSTFLTWLNTHTHGTGVGPSSPPLAPHVAPADALVLTDKIKMQ